MTEAHDHGHHPTPPSPIERRAAALEALLTEKGLVPEGFIEEVSRLYAIRHRAAEQRHRRRPGVGRPRVQDQVAQDGPAAVAELGFGGPEGNLVAVENRPGVHRPGVHNVVVCTRCSCYPWSVLGLPPAWYKDAPYRARTVREPRALLKEMGCEVPDEVAIRVWDASAEVRYLVVPERPAGTDGLSEGGAHGTRHTRLDDRCGKAVNTDLLDVDGVAAPPRRNGEIVFEAPWQSRAFGLCAAIIETCFGGDREPFRQQLIAAIAAEPDRPYWDSSTVALQELVMEAGLIDEFAIPIRSGTARGGPQWSGAGTR